jgi:hypothetical protein
MHEKKPTASKKKPKHKTKEHKGESESSDADAGGVKVTLLMAEAPTGEANKADVRTFSTALLNYDAVHSAVCCCAAARHLIGRGTCLHGAIVLAPYIGQP